MYLKKLVVLAALFSLSSIAAVDKLDGIINALKEQAPKVQKFVLDVADWADTPFKRVDELVKDHPRTALVIAALTGTLFRKASLVVCAGYGVCRLAKEPEQVPNANQLQAAVNEQKGSQAG